MARQVKRRYESSVRDAEAALTRARIRAAAAELIVSQGYVATTLKAIAERAGVGERTLYDRFGSKLELYRHTVNVLTVGGEGPVLSADRPQMVAARDAEDPREALSLHLEFAARLMERAGDLIMAGLVASASDEGLRDRVDRGITSAHEVHLGLTKVLARRGRLRPGLDAGTAADILYVLSSPATFHALRRDRRWSRTRYRNWLVESAIQQLLP